ncbi:hypothetical protein LTR56_026985 [Elasticomyces elasticus]|nr:hypothetical protein LTR22_027659 [Elasticomyces elasticus]KAK3614831.1 hypothetical protein LTR56_026985 [Elasticomyces elasticus]KAK4899338.1 hypothetical protein LTR49_027656 [Elasticomyces elasticus]
MHGLCKRCGKLVATGLARHERLAHTTCSTCRWQGLKKDFPEHSPCSPQAKTPVEKLGKVSEVLRVLGLKEIDVPWPVEALDALPNGREHHDLRRFGGSKGDIPQILNTTQHEKLPLGIDLAWKLTEVLNCDEDVTGSFFHVDVCSTSSVSAVSAKRFIMDITAGSDFRDTPVKWLNVLMKPILQGSDFQLGIQHRICELYNTDEATITLYDCDANILPKLAPVDLHHDLTGGICTARAIQPRGFPPGTAVKLWFFWPHSNTIVLPRYYSQRDTGVFQDLRDGIFIVQLEGETMLIPLGVLHCTLTLSPSLLIGSQFSFHDGFWLDRQLTSFRSELAADTDSTKRCTPHVALSHAVAQGLDNRLPNAVTVRCWLKCEAELRAAFDACSEHWQCIREGWRPYVKGKDCLFCKELPANSYHLLMDEEHLSRHVPFMQNKDLPGSSSRSYRTGLLPDAWNERQQSFQEDVDVDPDYVEPSISVRSRGQRKRKPDAERGGIIKEKREKKGSGVRL